MATRKIKDAKDLSTNELIYFKSHAQATYMSDGRTVEEAVNGMSGGGTRDTSNLATKDEIPVLDEYAKTEDIQEAIDNAIDEHFSKQRRSRNLHFDTKRDIQGFTHFAKPMLKRLSLNNGICIITHRKG